MLSKNYIFNVLLLRLTALKNSQQIRVELRAGGQKQTALALNSEELIKTLDKLLKPAKLDLPSIAVEIFCEQQTSVTSCRSIQIVQAALQVAKRYLS